MKTPLPPEASLVATPKKWPECNSYKLYSGIGTKVDFVAARKCAWSERLAVQADLEPKYSVASVVGGSAMLGVLYANGEGIEQNKPLAMRFACEAEMDHALKDIQALPVGATKAGNKLKFCDEAYTTFDIGYCAAWEAEISDQSRIRTIYRISEQFPRPTRDSLLALVRAQEAYSRAHADGEVDLSGSGRAIWQENSEQELRGDFLVAIQFFEKGNRPPDAKAGFASVDARLNRLYATELANAERHKSDYGAVQPDGIRSAERAWLRYRDAWVAFAKLRYPSVSRDSWLALLTEDRILVLKGVACEPGFDELPCPKSDEDDQSARPLP